MCVCVYTLRVYVCVCACERAWGAFGTEMFLWPRIYNFHNTVFVYDMNRFNAFMVISRSKRHTFTAHLFVVRVDTESMLFQNSTFFFFCFVVTLFPYFLLFFNVQRYFTNINRTKQLSTTSSFRTSMHVNLYCQFDISVCLCICATQVCIYFFVGKAVVQMLPVSAR